jgi:hypothetical protein
MPGPFPHITHGPIIMHPPCWARASAAKVKIIKDAKMPTKLVVPILLVIFPIFLSPFPLLVFPTHKGLLLQSIIAC